LPTGKSKPSAIFVKPVSSDPVETICGGSFCDVTKTCSDFIGNILAGLTGPSRGGAGSTLAINASDLVGGFAVFSFSLIAAGFSVFATVTSGFAASFSPPSCWPRFLRRALI
jgi:hypothetical protein